MAKDLSFAGAKLSTREGKLDKMIEEGKSVSEMEKFVIKEYGANWAKRIVNR